MRQIIGLTILVCLCLIGCSQISSDLELSLLPLATSEGRETLTDVTIEERSQPSDTTDAEGVSYVVVDTGQQSCFDASNAISCPQEGGAFFGQDGQYISVNPHYVDNGDGTVSDLQTGLMWQQSVGEKMTYTKALAAAEAFDLGGYLDWRLPTIKELYSLIDFSGIDPSGREDAFDNLKPFIDTTYFEFQYGDTQRGERIIDAQFWSSTEYSATTIFDAATTFGVNFADGRIKGYGRETPHGEMTQFVRYVRGNPDYGQNDFVANTDGTVWDQATGLMWMQSDSGVDMIWEEALDYCEHLDWAEFDDWRLPNAKELQSIVDYSRSPAVTNSAAIDPIFDISQLTDEAGDIDYPYFWTSTTHINQMMGGSNAVYLAFGKAMGYMQGKWIDVHGAGAQRSDPKEGDPSDYPTGHGPQGDAIRISNYARCVRGGVSHDVVKGVGIDPVTSGDVTPLSLNENPSAPSPPQEAIDACVGLKQSKACVMQAPHGTLTGICTMIEGQLACRPDEGPPDDPPGGP